MGRLSSTVPTAHSPVSYQRTTCEPDPDTLYPISRATDASSLDRHAWASFYSIGSEPDYYNMTKHPPEHVGYLQPFPDRRARLFGREAAVADLVHRADAVGTTVLAAAPLMGKTWTLTEVARRLAEDRR